MSATLDDDPVRRIPTLPRHDDEGHQHERSDEYSPSGLFIPADTHGLRCESALGQGPWAQRAPVRPMGQLGRTVGRFSVRA